MAERICLLTFYPTKCKDNCFNCDCGGAEATKDMYVSIHNVQRVCAITGGAADTDEGEYIAEVIRNNLENMVIPAADVQPVNQWISVDDKLPEWDKTVLVWYASDTLFGVSEGYGLSWYHGSWRLNELNGENIRILYWQYLPEKPKEG